MHANFPVPLFLSAINPLTYVGAPVGTYEVTAQATLIIRRGDNVLGDYTARARKTARYGLYYSATFRELDRSATTAVRAAIDESMAQDLPRLSQRARAATTQDTGNDSE